MGRRHRKASGPGVDLFSFMNIMAATIGVQTLLIVISALQIKPGVQAIRLLPAEGAAKGLQANYILTNGNGELELIGPQGRQTVASDDTAVDAFLDRIGEKNREQYLVIGVRPEGYVDFETVRSKAELRKITVGYEPLEPGLKVMTPEFEQGATQ
jgi:hypothetical protein